MAHTLGGLVTPRRPIFSQGRSVCPRGGFIHTFGGLSFHVSPSQGIFCTKKIMWMIVD